MILRKVLRCKIHRARITHADLHYEGSITIPPELMQAAGLAEYEAVCIWDVTNGNRLETYAIMGKPGENFICMNGAAAHLVRPNDLVIIAAFQQIDDQQIANYKPKLVFVDENNQIKDLNRKEVPGPSSNPDFNIRLSDSILV
jgi:aspartate 1-decarboxylase